MKAIVYKKPKFILEEIATPMPEENQIQVKIVAAGFNPIDYQMTEEGSEKKLLHSPIFGREFSGIVTALGNKASNFKIGDAVFCGSGIMGSNGTYAEYICVPEEIAMHLPNNVSFEEAAGIPSAGLTALQCLHRMQASKTDSILITGAAGGVGNMLVKLLLANGYDDFIVTAGNELSMNSLIEIGIKPNHIINYKIDKIEETALSLNQGKKFDIIIDLVGNAIADIVVKLLKTNGTYLDVTAFSTAYSREILFGKGATIMNISNYAFSLEKNYDYYKNGLEQLKNLLEKQLIKPPVIDVIGQLEVDTITKAHQMLRGNKTEGKKLIMKISSGTK